MFPEIKILRGDCRESLAGLPPESVHCCVTSPPYWGLRDYGLKPLKWEDGSKCCFGLEPTPGLYIAHALEIFRDVWRVLRKDGTLWLNMGDSFLSTAPGTRGDQLRQEGIFSAVGNGASKARIRQRPHIPNGLKPKDLIGMPWRLALALQADGWYLRTEIIWHKTNPMPESVTDRPTRAHEYIFLLSKSQRYFYDAEAIKEPASENTHARIAQAGLFGQRGGSKTEQYSMGFPGRKGRDRKPIEIIQHIARANGVNPKAKTPGVNSRLFQDRDPNHCSARKVKQNASFSAAMVGLVLKRNKRTVWTLATSPYKGAHFATFPPKLIEPCILAGCPKGGTVLDPFAGSGTTGMVAQQLRRNAILCEANPEYCKLIKQRCGV